MSLSGLIPPDVSLTAAAAPAYVGFDLCAELRPSSPAAVTRSAALHFGLTR